MGNRKGLPPYAVGWTWRGDDVLQYDRERDKDR